MREFAAMRNLDLWYARIDVEDVMREFSARGDAPSSASAWRRTSSKTRTKDSLKAFSKLTEIVDGEPRIISDPPLIVPIDELAGGPRPRPSSEALRGLIRQYRRTLAGDRRRLLERFRYVDAARKVVGVGSVGTRAWIVLMLGRDGDDPLFLQVKEAQASVLEPFLGKSEFAQPRPARRRGPAADAVGERHHARLAAHDRPRRPASATSTSASSGTRRARRSSR